MSCRRNSSEFERLIPQNNNVAINGSVKCGVYGSTLGGQENTDTKTKWPFPLWLLMTFLCMFYHRRVTRKRKCYSCYVKDISHRRASNFDNCTNEEAFLLDPICLEYEYDGDEWLNDYQLSEAAVLDNENNDQIHDGNCDVCKVTLWNHLGQAKAYSDQDIGVTSWNFGWSKYVSILGLLFAIACIIYEIGYYMNKMWGRQDKLLHFISYNAFLICISLYPVMSICSKVRSISGRIKNVPLFSWATTLNARFIVKRMQFLNLHKKGLPGKFLLFLCLIWPTCNAIYRTCIYFYLVKRKTDFHTKFSVASTGALLIWWGCFVYVLYLMRISFQRQFMLTLAYIKDKEGALDHCRTCLSHVVLDFNCFRSCIVIYMAVMVPFTVLGVTTNISWQYRLSGSCYFVEHFEIESSINILIWSNIVMFIVLSVIAIGGLDLCYIWDNFSLSITQMQNEIHGQFWRKIFTHISHISGEHSTMSLTLVWSVIGFYMGLHFGDDQEIDYGVGKCNLVNITQVNSIVGYATY